MVDTSYEVTPTIEIYTVIFQIEFFHNFQFICICFRCLSYNISVVNEIAIALTKQTKKRKLKNELLFILFALQRAKCYSACES